MTWGQEIFRAFLLTFGVTEIISNITYLIKDNGMNLARKQHQELPFGLSDMKIKIKVMMMLIFGLLFFIGSLSTFILHRYMHNVILAFSILYCIYGIIEALYYKHWKTTGFAFVTMLFLILSVFI